MRPTRSRSHRVIAMRRCRRTRRWSPGERSLKATDVSDGSKAANTSPSITVNAGGAAQLGMQTQPSATATAGVAFAQQPVIQIQDAFGNLVSSDNGTVVTA